MSAPDADSVSKLREVVARLRRTIEATTDRVEGGRRVGSIAEAMLLTNVADEGIRVLYQCTREFFLRHGSSEERGNGVTVGFIRHNEAPELWAAIERLRRFLGRERRPGCYWECDELISDRELSILDGTESLLVNLDGEGGEETPDGASRAKRSTDVGDARAKLVAALSMYHGYEGGSCLKTDPVGNNELARLANVSRSTASDFFRTEFGGLKRYKAKCTDVGTLVDAIRTLRGEFTPAELSQMTIEAFEAGKRSNEE